MPTSEKAAVGAAKRAHSAKGTIRKKTAETSAGQVSALARMLPGMLASMARQAADLPEGDVASLTASAVDLYARRSASAATSGRDSDQIGLCLVRPKSSAASQALSSFRVELHEDSRRSQLARLAEFRSDTQAQLDDVRRWCDGLGDGRRLAVPSGGLISAGMVMRLSSEEAARLRRDVGHVQVVQNRVLSLVSPTQRSLGSAAAPPPHAGWHLEAIGQRTARANGRAFSGRGVRVAVLDTGIQLDHPELGGRVTEGWRIDKTEAAVTAAAVVRDPAHGDTDGHGTHVAGLICGTDVGVAPDALLTSVLMMPSGFATTFDFIRCLDWVVQHPEVSLVNFSAGEFPYNDDMVPIVADVVRMGVLPFFAVGNDGENKSRSPGNYIDGVSVGSVDPDDGARVSSFSGSGRQVENQTAYDVPDLVAPGARIWSSYRDSGFATLNGTSMATPVACGVAACLLEQAGGQLAPADLFDLLRRGCVALAGEPAGRQGRGRVTVPVKAA